MSDMKCLIKCPICGEILQKYGEIDPDAGTSIVLGANCPKCGIGNSDIKLWQELIRTRKTLEQSEICCTEWEKQALDYKAENIALSGDLERTRKALDAAIRRLDQMTWGCDSSDAEHLLKEIKEITTQEQKD